MLPLKDDIPTRRFPVLTVAIIVLCTLVYFGFEHGGIGLGQRGNERVVEYGAIPYELTHPGDDCGVTSSGDDRLPGPGGRVGHARPTRWSGT